MTSLIVASKKANTGLTDIDFNDIYNTLQNAGKRTKKKKLNYKKTRKQNLL
jgi:hypothetical protein